MISGDSLQARRERLRALDFYLVTDSGLSRAGTVSDVARALEAGCGIVQYREKAMETREMVEEAREIKRLCEGHAIFLVNDRIDVALAVDADGVHIGQDDMPFGIARELLGPGKIIGLTTHDIAESVEAERIGADYIGLSPIFATGTKKDAGEACGVGMIGRVREAVSLPITVIGGINGANIGEVIEAGADNAVAISAVLCAEDVEKAVEELTDIIRRAKQKR